jgi:coatomer protein complex subunit gamma
VKTFAAQDDFSLEYCNSDSADHNCTLSLAERPIHHLEWSIQAYMSTSYVMSSPEALTLDKLPILEDYTEISATRGHTAMDITSADAAIAATVGGTALPPREKVDPTAAVYAIPEIAALGSVFRSSAPVPLTESETEYGVPCIKHIMPEYVLLQFFVQNTIEDQRLDNVRVSVEGSDDGAIFEVTSEIAADDIMYRYGSTKNCFTVWYIMSLHIAYSLFLFCPFNIYTCT